jgi:hypothetical protein
MRSWDVDAKETQTSESWSPRWMMTMMMRLMLLTNESRAHGHKNGTTSASRCGPHNSNRVVARLTPTEIATVQSRPVWRRVWRNWAANIHPEPVMMICCPSNNNNNNQRRRQHQPQKKTTKTSTAHAKILCINECKPPDTRRMRHAHTYIQAPWHMSDLFGFVELTTLDQHATHVMPQTS